MLWKLLRQKSLNRTEKSFLNQNFVNKSKGAQEAHEAIRPMSRHTVNIDRDQARCMTIWKELWLLK
jgi:DNA topoisomerase IA